MEFPSPKKQEFKNFGVPSLSCLSFLIGTI